MIPTHPTVEGLRVALAELGAGMPKTVNTLSEAAEALLKEFDSQAFIEWRTSLGGGVKIPYSTEEQARKGAATHPSSNLECRIVWRTDWRVTGWRPT